MTAGRRHAVDRRRAAAPPSHSAATARLVVRGVVRGHVETAVGVLRDHMAEPWTLDSLTQCSSRIGLSLFRQVFR